MMRLIIFILLAIALVILIIRHIEGSFIFFPMKGEPTVIQGAVTHEDVIFTVGDGKKLHGWLIPAAGPAPIVLFLHGNAGNMGHRWEKIHILYELGVSIFIFDYRGYGRSEGKPSEAGIYRDVDAAYAYLTAHGFAPDTIVVYGESIGGAFAVDLAARRPVKTVILEDTFTSVPAMIRRTMPFIPGFILATRLDSLTKISKISAPKLIFHSVDDEIVPFEMGQALYGAASGPKTFVPLRGGHNTAFLDDFHTYQKGLREFLDRTQSTES